MTEKRQCKNGALRCILGMDRCAVSRTLNAFEALQSAKVQTFLPNKTLHKHLHKAEVLQVGVGFTAIQMKV